jgi:hypothetical protein
MKGRRYRLAVLNTATSREIPYKSLFIAEKINFFNGEDVPASHVWLLERKGIYMYWSWWFYFPLKAQDSNLIGRYALSVKLLNKTIDKIPLLLTKDRIIIYHQFVFLCQSYNPTIGFQTW